MNLSINDKIIKERYNKSQKKVYICRCYCPPSKCTSRGVSVTATASISDIGDDDNGQALHCGKASHDALSTGFPEITTKDECQRHCRV
jgi:hypothetical protein